MTETKMTFKDLGLPDSFLMLLPILALKHLLQFNKFAYRTY